MPRVAFLGNILKLNTCFNIDNKNPLGRKVLIIDFFIAFKKVIHSKCGHVK